MEPHPIEYKAHPDEPTDPLKHRVWLSKHSPITIYAIHAAGDTSQVWYVGQSRTLDLRERSHRAAVHPHASKPLYRWLAFHEWKITPLERVLTRSEARVAERRWIKHYAAIDPRLFNVRGHTEAAVPRVNDSLSTLRDAVEARGGRVFSDLLVLISKTGTITLARWEGAELQKIKPTDLVSGNE